MLLNTQEVYDKFYSELNPTKYWMFTLQKDLALEAVNFYITFNNLSLIDLDTISEPYKFTKLSCYFDIYSIIAQVGDPKEWSFSPDCNGGITAVYVGDENLILTIDLNAEHTVTVECINKNVISKTIFSYEVPTPEKIISIKDMFKRLFKCYQN